MIARAIANGDIALPIVLLTVVEFAVLGAYHRATAKGPAAATLLPNILAGDFLLLAWFFSRHHWALAAACLLGALLAHVTDLLRR